MIVYKNSDSKGQPLEGWAWRTSYLEDAPRGIATIVQEAYQKARSVYREKDRKEDQERIRQEMLIGA